MRCPMARGCMRCPMARGCMRCPMARGCMRCPMARGCMRCPMARGCMRCPMARGYMRCPMARGCMRCPMARCCMRCPMARSCMRCPMARVCMRCPMAGWPPPSRLGPPSLSCLPRAPPLVLGRAPQGAAGGFRCPRARVARLGKSLRSRKPGGLPSPRSSRGLEGRVAVFTRVEIISTRRNRFNAAKSFQRGEIVSLKCARCKISSALQSRRSARRRGSGCPTAVATPCLPAGPDRLLRGAPSTPHGPGRFNPPPLPPSPSLGPNGLSPWRVRAWRGRFGGCCGKRLDEAQKGARRGGPARPAVRR